MKHSLQLKLSQHLTLTPQLQQSIKLLQLSTLELNQELERYLLENPLLEREDDHETPAPVAESGPSEAPVSREVDDHDGAPAEAAEAPVDNSERELPEAEAEPYD